MFGRDPILNIDLIIRQVQECNADPGKEADIYAQSFLTSLHLIFWTAFDVNERETRSKATMTIITSRLSWFDRLPRKSIWIRLNDVKSYRDPPSLPRMEERLALQRVKASNHVPMHQLWPSCSLQVPSQSPLIPSYSYNTRFGLDACLHQASGSSAFCPSTSLYCVFTLCFPSRSTPFFSSHSLSFRIVAFLCLLQPPTYNLL